MLFVRKWWSERSTKRNNFVGVWNDGDGLLIYTGIRVVSLSLVVQLRGCFQHYLCYVVLFITTKNIEDNFNSHYRSQPFFYFREYLSGGTVVTTR
jgi:hypothetical protein